MMQPQQHPITLPFPLRRLQAKPHLFILDYDNSKLKSRNPWTHEQKKIKHTCEGTVYSNGRVTLDNGTTFENTDEMSCHFELAGNYTLTYLEEVGL